MAGSENNEQGRKARRVLSVLKSKMVELESLEAEIRKKKAFGKRSSKSIQVTLERLLVPPLAVLKEKKKPRA